MSSIYGNGQQYSGYGQASSYSRGSASGSEASEDSAFSIDENTSGGSDSVSLSTANQALIMADDNRDGVVDQQELANASYQLLSNENATEAEIGVGNLFATMVLGGKDGEGLFPDINQDGGITANELALLARGDDDTASISADDFSLAYGDEVNPEGNSFTLEDLEAVASGQAPGSTAQPATGEAGITESLTAILGSLTELLGTQGTGAPAAGAPAAGAPAAGAPAAGAPAAGAPAAGAPAAGTPAAGAPAAGTPAAGAPAAGTPAAGAPAAAPGASSDPMAALLSIITSLLTLLTSLFSGQQGDKAA